MQFVVVCLISPVAGHLHFSLAPAKLPLVGTRKVSKNCGTLLVSGRCHASFSYVVQTAMSVTGEGACFFSPGFKCSAFNLLKIAFTCKNRQRENKSEEWLEGGAGLGGGGEWDRRLSLACGYACAT